MPFDRQQSARQFALLALAIAVWINITPNARSQSTTRPATVLPIQSTGQVWGAPPAITPIQVPSSTSSLATDAAPSIAAVATAPTLFADPSIRLAQAPALPNNDPFAGPGDPKLQWPPPGGRDTSFQRVTFESSFLPAFDDDGLGITGVRANAVFGLPFPTRDAPLLITPGFETLFLEGPTFDDVPPRLNAATVEFSAFRLLTDRWLLNLATTVGVYADDHSFGDSDALRVTGRALGVYQWTHDWKGVVGLVFLNRGDFSVIPAVGLQYDDGRKKIDLIFPRPRIAWRLDAGGPPGVGGEQRWLFVGGEFGGNEWAVRRNGVSDTLDYNDLRVQIGYETKRFGGVSTKYEFGYVFARELEFGSDDVETSLDDTLFLRAGFTY